MTTTTGSSRIAVVMPYHREKFGVIVNILYLFIQNSEFFYYIGASIGGTYGVYNAVL